MANELLKKADAEAIFDSFAAQYQLVLAAIGQSGESNTLNLGATNAQTDVLTHTNADSNLWLAADLGDAVGAFITATQMNTQAGYFMAPAADMMKAMERHAVKRNTAYADINAWLSDIGIIVHPYCRSIYGNITPANVWPLTLESTTGTHDAGNESADLAVWDVTASATGSITSGTAIDSTIYGDGLIKAVVTNAGGIGAGSDLVFTINGKDHADATVQGTITVSAAAAQNTEFDVLTVRFSSITSITHTNGTSGDQVTFRPRDDRSPAL